MHNNYVTLAAADKTMMAAYTAIPKNIDGRLPAIILIQEAFGVNNHMRDVARRFADEGYVVIAPEIYHRTAIVGFEGDYNDFASVAPHFNAITPEGLEADLKACYDWLQHHERVSAESIFSIGFCLGGRVSFFANTVLPLKAAVSFYGGGINQILQRTTNLSGRHLFFWGGQDTHIGPEQVEQTIKALDDAGKEYVNVKISYTGHAFFCNERANYNPKAAHEAWALTLAFLETSLSKEH